MKGQSRKVIQGVMKSPSPDIAHRSIIANTKSPANQIKDYIKMRQSSNSPKSMTTSFYQICKGFSSDNQEINILKRYVQQLQTKIKFYEKIKISHDQLNLINQSLNNQISQLKIELRQIKQRSQSNKSKNISPSNSRAPSPKGNGTKGVSLVRNSGLNANPQMQIINPTHQNQSILRQFNERIVKMSEENKRLGKKLKEIKDQKDFLQKQNYNLKVQKPYDNQPHYVSSQDNQFLKKFFIEESSKIANYYQKTNEDKISQLKRRLSEVETQLINISQRQKGKRQYTRTNTPNELKANTSIDTNFRSENQYELPSSLPGNRYNMIESKYTTSPSQFKAFTLQTSPIRVLQEQKQKIKRQNQFLLSKNSDLQKEIKTILFENNALSKKLKQIQSEASIQQSKKPLSESNFSIYKSLQQKNQSLESELTKKISEIKIKGLMISQLQKQLEQSKVYNQNKSKDFEKNIDQQRQKNTKYLSDIRKLQEKIHQLQQNYLNRAKYQSLQKQLKQIQKSYTKLNKDFQRYLQMILQIRYSITGEGVQTCLRQVQDKWGGYDELELQIIKIHQCYQILVQNLKKNLLQKQRKIAQLEMENKVLNESNQQSKIQLQKLQRAIIQYQQPIRANMSEQQVKKRMIIHQSKSKNKQKCQIRDYINRTVSKIGDLQYEIQIAINSNKKDRKLEPKTRYFGGVDADDLYRTSSKQIQKRINREQQTDNNQNNQDPSLIEDEDITIPYK